MAAVGFFPSRRTRPHARGHTHMGKPHSGQLLYLQRELVGYSAPRSSHKSDVDSFGPAVPLGLGRGDANALAPTPFRRAFHRPEEPAPSNISGAVNNERLRNRPPHARRRIQLRQCRQLLRLHHLLVADRQPKRRHHVFTGDTTHRRGAFHLPDQRHIHRFPTLPNGAASSGSSPSSDSRETEKFAY